MKSFLHRTAVRLSIMTLLVAGSIAFNSSASAMQGTPRAQTRNANRERRAEAYAKLLEGQRYLNAGREGGISREMLGLAQAAFQQAAILDPTLAEAHTALAEIAFFFTNNASVAIAEAQTATRIDRQNFGAHKLLSRIYALQSGLREGRADPTIADQAIAALREVVRLQPGDAEGWAIMGELYLATGRNSEAINAFTRWAAAPPPVDTRFFQYVTQGGELSPDYAAARLGQAFLRAGRPVEAVAAIRRAIALNPEKAEYLNLLRQAQEATGGASGSRERP